MTFLALIFPALDFSLLKEVQNFQEWYVSKKRVPGDHAKQSVLFGIYPLTTPNPPPPPPKKKEATNSRDIYAVGIEENYNFAGIQLHLSQMYSDTKTFTNLQTKRLFYYVIDPCHACVLIVASFLI